MTALIYELIWIRPLSLVFGTTMYAVSTIVASFILGLAIGSWIAGKYSDRLTNPLKYFAYIQILVGFFGILLLPVFDLMPKVYVDLYHMTYPNQHLFLITQIFMSMGIITIPATLMGTTLPLMLKTYSREFTTIGKDVGKLDASNSIGAFFGTLVAGFLIIPLLGIHDGIIVTALINILLGTGILITKKYLSWKYVSIILIILIPVLTFYPSYNEDNLANAVFLMTPNKTIEKYEQHVKNQNVIFNKESIYQNIIVTSNNHTNYNTLKLDGKIQCNSNDRVVTGLINLAYLPFKLYAINYGLPQTALNIGLGCGTTSYALSQNVNTTTIEIDPIVVESNKFFYGSIDHRLIIDDARNWLLRHDEKFDMITSEPTEPWMGWSLYTKEHFEILSNSLTETGVVAQWIPIYELRDDEVMIMYNTFHSVFPYVYVYAMELGKSSQIIFIGSHHELKITETELYLFNQDDLIDVKTELNTDDKPVIEFATANSLYNTEKHPINLVFNNEESYRRIIALN
jgi:spermidine synthase